MVPPKVRYHNFPFSILNFQLPNDSKEQFRERRHEQHTVETVQHTAMSRKNMSVILNAGLALDDRERQVADLAEHRADCTEHDRRPKRHFNVKRPVHNHSRDQHEDSTSDHAADGTLYRLFRADDRRQLMLAEQHAREQSAGVRTPSSKQRQQHDERTVVVVHLENPPKNAHETCEAFMTS